MSAANLINLDVDALFEQHNVSEIDIMQKKIQNIVEEKREELRTMVGERYRDLLQAADTIAAMRESSSKLIEQIDCVSANCRDLNEQQLIGFKTAEPTEMLVRNRNANKQLNNYFSTMVQIKLLTALPELIWSRIDREHYLGASELFIFSRHISTGLQLDAKNTLMQHLPVAKKQWEILKPFHLTIKQSVLATLEREHLSAEVAVNCLLSLLLLEKSNLMNVLKTFLQLRSNAYLHCLHEDAQEHKRVKKRILDSLQILNDSLQLLEECFLPNGLIQQQLQQLCEPQAPPTLALLDKNDTEYAYVLPDIIANFRPKFEAHTLENEQLCATLNDWLQQTQRIANKQLKERFQLVVSINTIQEIKQTAHAFKEQLQIPQLQQLFQLQQQQVHTLDFFEQCYVPLIIQRERDIISDSWAQAIEQIFATLKNSLAAAATRKAQLWTENLQDLPLSLAHALSEDLKLKQLLMRAKGYDTEVINICTAFDLQLKNIVAEIDILLQDECSSIENKRALIEFLRQTAFEQMAAFIAKIKGLQLQATQRKELILVVRSCVALVELCPHLKICFCSQSSWRQWLAHAYASNQQHWQQICDLIEAEVFSLWHLIMQSMLDEVSCSANMPQVLAHNVMLEDFANWQLITLQQSDEQNNPVQSSFRIPNQPSISLQSHLFAIIQLLNSNIPQTLPPKVLQQFNRLLLKQLLAHYEQVIGNDATQSNQNVAIQLSFDIRFLQSIFQLSRDERILHESYAKLLGTLKDFIDPFDYELFAEHIHTNIAASVKRLCCQLGVLTPSTALVTPTTAAVAATNLAQEKDPNVLSLSSCGSTSLWFPLLPIITPHTATESRKFAADEKQTTTPSSSKATASALSTFRKTESAAKSKGSASSFFGAMSQEWFR